MIFLAEFKHQAAPLLRGACVPKAFAVLAAVDEVWDFIGKKEKRVRPKDDQNLSDCYTFVAIEQHSKLGLNVAMGKRDKVTMDIYRRPPRRFQITKRWFRALQNFHTGHLRRSR